MRRRKRNPQEPQQEDHLTKLSPAIQNTQMSPSQTSMNPLQRLTPDTILQLQRSHGNQYVQRLIERQSSGEIQRVVSDGRRATTARALLHRFKTREAEAYRQAQNMAISDQQIADVCRIYVDSADTTFYIAEVFKHIKQMIKIPTGASRPVTSNGVTAHIRGIDAAFPKGLNVDVNNSDRHKINTNLMSLSADLLVNGPPDEAARWSVGFVQTVNSLERIVEYKHNRSGQEAVWRTYLDGPHRDGPSGYAGPWYDPSAMKRLDNKDAQRASPSMQDQPGFSWSFDPGHTVTRVSGRDSFNTWLIMRRDDGQVRFLRNWSWHVDYTASDNASRLGISFDGYAPSPTGREAVLDGPVGKDDFQQETRVLPKTTHTMSFDEMKRM